MRRRMRAKQLHFFGSFDGGGLSRRRLQNQPKQYVNMIMSYFQGISEYSAPEDPRLEIWRFWNGVGFANL